MLSRIVKKIVWIWFCDTQLKTTLICERKRRQQITSTILKASSDHQSQEEQGIYLFFQSFWLTIESLSAFNTFTDMLAAFMRVKGSIWTFDWISILLE